MDSKVSYQIVDGKILIAVDSNLDGKAVVTIALDLAQVLAEVAAAFKK